MVIPVSAFLRDYRKEPGRFSVKDKETMPPSDGHYFFGRVSSESRCAIAPASLRNSAVSY
jgi:hypothetical protein